MTTLTLAQESLTPEDAVSQQDIEALLNAITVSEEDLRAYLAGCNSRTQRSTPTIP